MRHRVAKKKLSRTTEHRIAMRRNMAQSLFEHGQVATTLAKAKFVRPFCERLITLARKAKDGDVAAKRRVTMLLCDRAVIDADHQEAYEDLTIAQRRKVLRARSGRRHRTGAARGGMKFTAESLVRRLIETVAPSFEGRPGGYTRIIKLGTTRSGDAGPRAVLQLVGREESPGSVVRPEKTARRVRADARYQAAAKAVAAAGARRPSKAGAKPAQDAAESNADAEAS